MCRFSACSARISGHTQTDRPTKIQEPCTVTLAAHECQGLIKFVAIYHLCRVNASTLVPLHISAETWVIGTSHIMLVME